MILTVTLNAALDRTLVAPGFSPGQSRTADRALILGGGKGLNVARALHGLGEEVLALGLAGGATGAAIRSALSAEGIAHRLTEIAGESRTCTAIADPESGLATEINEPGPQISDDEAQSFLDQVGQALPGACLVALSGSLPSGVPADFYVRLIEIAHRAGIPCVLDTRGEALRLGLAAAPFLAKPNQHEIAELLGGAINPDDPSVVQRLPRPGPTLLAITLGPAGAILHGPAGSWRASAPQVKPIDTVGAGDSFVAGLCAAFSRAAGTGPLETGATRAEVLEDALRLATAVAVANTLTMGAGLYRRTDVERLRHEVRITRLA